MKLSSIAVLFFTFILLQGCFPPRKDAEKVTYEVILNIFWNKFNYPETFPDDAFMSNTLYAFHSSKDTLIKFNTPISPGLSLFSRTGNFEKLVDEFRSDASRKITPTTTVINTRSLTTSSINHKVTVIKDDDHTNATILLKLFPTPDWFIGIRNMNLLDENGLFINEISVNFNPYDAGIDASNTYKGEAIPETTPQGLSLITKGPLAQFKPIGTITFKKLD